MGINCSITLIGPTSRSVLIAVFSLLAVTQSKAQGTPKQRAACTSDAVRLCSSEIPDVARVKSCMRAHQTSLSERCRIAFLGASPTRSYAQRRHETRVAYRYARHGLYGHHHWARSGEALAIASRVMGGFAMACQSGSIPSDYCSMSQGLLQSGMAERFMNSGMAANSGMAEQFMSSGGAESLIGSFMR